MADEPGGNEQASGSNEDLAQLEGRLGGKYRVLRLLGRGGFGSVYLVEITAGMTGQKLALKLLGDRLKDDDDRRQRAINEIRVAMRLVDKYIIQIRDVGTTDDGQTYYTMDYCPGATLRAVLNRERTLDIRRTILIILRMLRALKTAHAHGVIHRDLKPENIMVEKRGDRETVRVLDFGIATAVGEPSPLKKRRFVGSPHYMPPEQFLDEKLGYYTDLYAVGVVLYECITGERPYHGANAREVFEDMKARAVLAPDQFNPKIKDFPGLNELMVKALERNPERRFQRASEFFKGLEPFVEKVDRRAEATSPRPQAPRPRRRQRVRRVRQGHLSWLGFVALVVFVALIVFSLKHLRHQAPPPSKNVDPGGETVSVEGDDLETPASRPLPASDPATTAANEARKLEAHLHTARQAFATRSWPKVREQCDEALTLDRENGEALRLRGLAELEMGLFNDAARTLQLAIDHGDGVPGVAIYVALATAKIKKTPPAMDEVKSTLWQLFYEHPGDLSVITLFAEVLDEDEDEANILAFLREAHGRIDLPVVKELHQKWRVRRPAELRATRERTMAEARQAFDSGDWAIVVAKGLETYRELGTADLGLKLAVAYRELGQFPDSIEVLRELALQTREHYGSLALVALLFGETYLEYYKATKKAERLEYARLNLGAAVTLCEVATDVDRMFEARARTLRARCWAYRGNLKELEKDVKAARLIADDRRGLALAQARAFVLLAEVSTAAKDRETAYRRAISRFGHYHRLPKSERDGAEAGGVAYYEQGLCYVALGRAPSDYREANNCFSRAKKAGLKTAELYITWGETAFKRGNRSRAAEYYRESYNLKANIVACYLAAAYFTEVGSKVAARKMLERGIVDFPRDREVEKLKALLDRIGR